MGIPHKRPVNLDLRHIRLPAPALTSLLHRVSGLLLFVVIAPALRLFQESLASEEGFAAVKASLNGSGMRVILVILVWALSHHVLAGMRLLCLDFHCGVERHLVRLSAHITNVGALVSAFAAAAVLL